MRTLAALLLLLPLTFALAADDDKPDEAKRIAAQKKFLEDLKQSLDTPKAAVVETKNLLVFSTLPPEKNKAIGDAMEKQYALAMTALKFDDTDKNWEGKLGVLVLGDRGEYTVLMTKVEKRGVPEKGETAYSKNSGDFLFVAVTTGRGEVGIDLERKAQIQLAISLLQRKAGATTQFPLWVTDGFGRAVAFRASPQKNAVERGKMRSVAGKTKMNEIWGENWGDDTYLAATSFVDFLAFGPEKAKFVDFIKGLAPGENGKASPITGAFESAKIDAKKVEGAWKKWAASGK